MIKPEPPVADNNNCSACASSRAPSAQLLEKEYTNIPTITAEYNVNLSFSKVVCE